MRTTEFSYDSANHSWLRHGFKDMFESLKRFRLVSHLSSQDIKLRYRRTVLGPIWTLLNAIIFVALMGTVYAMLFKIKLVDFLPFFGTGYFVWVTIFAVCMEASNSFVLAELIIKSIRVPYSTHILRCVIRNSITFLHMVPVPIAVALFYGVDYDFIAIFKMLWGWVLLMLNGFWVAMVIALISTRYRDFQQITATALQILFFTTPIFWSPDLLEGHAVAKAILADYNPVFQQIEVIRAPLIGTAISWDPYIILTISGVLGLGFAGLCLGWSMRRISIWL